MTDWTRDLANEEPPSKSNKDKLKLCIPSSGDLYSAIFGCHPLQAGNNNFRSLVAFSGIRRGSILEAHRKD